MEEEQQEQASDAASRWPVDPANGSVRIQLSYPAKGGALTSVSVRRPKAGDLRAVSAISDDFDRALAIAQRLTGLTQEAFDDLDVVDMSEIMGVATSMQRKSPR